ncbi:universal stress protein [Pseudonocardia halophobica]|uniref:Universal stress protein n=1 Tax=Pseudonocardia halophobica TaxID=29401 RepID=A0A9W6KZM2_9PSEU|nr:universal stress protein [Pseudonocardia halophobica]GLL09486.1 universal stress protein [Pseudonocardia halophobica]
MTEADREAGGAGRGRGEIVVGVDGSPSSLEALRWAVRQSELTGAPVRAVITWSIPVHYAPMAVSQAWSDWPERARQTLEDAVRAALPPEQVQAVTTEVAEGNASALLLEAAKDAELVVVGSRGHGGFVGLLLGSTAQHVTTHARCPVLVVHEPT